MTDQTEITETDVEDEDTLVDDQPDTDEQTTDPEVDQTEQEEPDTFPRSVVEKLRKENAGYREKAKKAEQYAQELHAARVAATGRLADPTDLPFDPEHLEDHDALVAAVEDLLATKPHLASRKPRGDVGQGLSGASDSVDLAGILRQRA